MPYQVKKVGKYYKLWKIKEKKFQKNNFKTKEAAINQAKNWMKWRKEVPVVKGNKILNARKLK
jgi:hypothetical protein